MNDFLNEISGTDFEFKVTADKIWVDLGHAYGTKLTAEFVFDTAKGMVHVCYLFVPAEPDDFISKKDYIALKTDLEQKYGKLNVYQLSKAFDTAWWQTETEMVELFCYAHRNKITEIILDFTDLNQN